MAIKFWSVQARFLLILVVMAIQTGLYAQAGELSYSTYLIPQTNSAPSDMVLLPPGIATISAEGGLYCPQLKAWQFKPGKFPITSFSRDYLDSCTYIMNDSLGYPCVKKLSKPYGKTVLEPIVNLPKGNGGLSVPFHGMLLIHHQADSESVVMLMDVSKQDQDTIYRAKTPIVSVFPISADSFLVAHPHKVVLLTPLAPAKTLYRVDLAIEDVMYLPDGRLIVSVGDGIFVVNSQRKVEWLSKWCHGKLGCYGQKLYVMDVSQSALIVMDIPPSQ